MSQRTASLSDTIGRAALSLYPLKTTYELFFKSKDELLRFYLVCFILLRLPFHCCETELKFKIEFNWISFEFFALCQTKHFKTLPEETVKDICCHLLTFRWPNNQSSENNTWWKQWLAAAVCEGWIGTVCFSMWKSSSWILTGVSAPLWHKLIWEISMKESVKYIRFPSSVHCSEGRPTGKHDIPFWFSKATGSILCRQKGVNDRGRM